MRAEVVAALLAAQLETDDTKRAVRIALEEDFRYGPDVTSLATVSGGMITAEVVAREPGVLAGIPVALVVLGTMDRELLAEPLRADGDRLSPGDAVLRVCGPATLVLGAERTMLNFLTHLSGIATATRAWVDAVAGTGATIRDTRKTLPGLRVLQKYAVRCGGGQNHRMGLGDAALIKDNHIGAAGGVTAAVQAVAASGVPLEVECDTLDQVREALEAKANLILLDNMDLDSMRAAVQLARRFPGVKLEASGGLRLDSARQVAETGVDYLSVGALTHSSRALDLGLDLRPAR